MQIALLCPSPGNVFSSLPFNPGCPPRPAGRGRCGTSHCPGNGARGRRGKGVACPLNPSGGSNLSTGLPGIPTEKAGVAKESHSFALFQRNSEINGAHTYPKTQTKILCL